MKISELSQVANVPLPTIKFYIREGLLPAGERTARNQAEYTAVHVERLALIRAMRDEGGLSIETIANVLRASDAAKEDFVVAAIDALERPTQAAIEVGAEALREAAASVLALAQRRGWKVDENDRSVRDAARALAIINLSMRPHDELRALDVYADAMERVANFEIDDDWAPDESPNAALRFAVLGTVLVEPFMLALRRIAHVARTRKLQRPAAGSKGRSKR